MGTASQALEDYRIKQVQAGVDAGKAEDTSYAAAMQRNTDATASGITNSYTRSRASALGNNVTNAVRGIGGAAQSAPISGESASSRMYGDLSMRSDQNNVQAQGQYAATNLGIQTSANKAAITSKYADIDATLAQQSAVAKQAEDAQAKQDEADRVTALATRWQNGDWSPDVQKAMAGKGITTDYKTWNKANNPTTDPEYVAQQTYAKAVETYIGNYETAGDDYNTAWTKAVTKANDIYGNKYATNAPVGTKDTTTGGTTGTDHNVVPKMRTDGSPPIDTITGKAPEAGTVMEDSLPYLSAVLGVYRNSTGTNVLTAPHGTQIYEKADLKGASGNMSVLGTDAEGLQQRRAYFSDLEWAMTQKEAAYADKGKNPAAWERWKGITFNRNSLNQFYKDNISYFENAAVAQRAADNANTGQEIK